MRTQAMRTDPPAGSGTGPEREGRSAPPPAPRIRPLPELVVNQIAAGEVVERPASVVKELLDNAIDAGARRIEVDLEGGGIELIRVRDDGGGMSPEELPLSVSPHATSKLTDAAQLDRIATMGFRGEALASIASVSRFSIRSRRAESDAAARLDVEGGAAGEVRPDAGPVGTTVSVRTLFFNTPARRKFLRTAPTEQGHCVETVRAAAMAHPHIGFACRANERVLLELPAGQTLPDRVTALLGEEFAERLLIVEADAFEDARGLTLWGLVGRPDLARPTARAQRFFVNGRPVQDRVIQHALREAFRGLIDPGRHPMAALLIEMDPSAVDVNVHPSKAEVRFRDSGVVHQLVLHSVREALRRADLTRSLDVRDRPATPIGAGLEQGPTGEGDAGVEGNASAAERFASLLRAQPPPQAWLAEERQAADERAAPADASGEGGASAPPATPPPAPGSPQAASGEQPMPDARPVDGVLQVHKTYLVTQDAGGVVIIDQHALHERVMFESIMGRLERGPLERQRLLTPGIVEATPTRVERLTDLQGVLDRLGIEAAPAGPAAVAIHSFPTLLFDRRVDPVEFVSELLERAESAPMPAGEEEAMHEVVDMMACKAAVKAGDRLSESELAELLSMRERVDRSGACPHGRPTSLRLSIRDLERAFGRT